MSKNCRLCDGKILEDMTECDSCWEVYTGLSHMSDTLIKKLLNEAGKTSVLNLKENTMNPNRKDEIKKELIELSKSVSMFGFNPKCPTSIWNLTRKLIGQIKLGNKTRIKMYLAFCIKQWPAIDDCPVDRRVLKQAISAIM